MVTGVGAAGQSNLSDMQRVKLFRCDFEKSNNRAKVENLKHMEIECQLQNTFFQRKIIGILKAHSKLEHVTLSLNGTLSFWKDSCKQIKSLPSLKLSYHPKKVAEFDGVTKIVVKKAHLVNSPHIERFSLEFDRPEKNKTNNSLNNRELVTTWIDFVIENQSIEKLEIHITNWFDEKHLDQIFGNLPNLNELTILQCNISMSKYRSDRTHQGIDLREWTMVITITMFCSKKCNFCVNTEILRSKFYFFLR